MDINEGAFIHSAAVLHGNIKVGYGSSIWPGAVLRGDYNSIAIGDYSSVQDNCVLHCAPFTPVQIGDWVTVGHGTVIHGSVIGDHVVVGMGSVLLDGVTVGSGSFIAAGSMVPGKTEIPPNSFVNGWPAKIRPARPETADKNKAGALTYYLLSRRYMKGVEIFPFEELMSEMKKWQEENQSG